MKQQNSEKLKFKHLFLNNTLLYKMTAALPYNFSVFNKDIYIIKVQYSQFLYIKLLQVNNEICKI